MIIVTKRVIVSIIIGTDGAFSSGIKLYKHWAGSLFIHMACWIYKYNCGLYGI